VTFKSLGALRAIAPVILVVMALFAMLVAIRITA
jgi:hypothetical protein